MVPLIPAILMAFSASTMSVADSAITGCLQKGSTDGTYTLASKDGKTYKVTSKTLKLAGHVGHTVTLTGDVKDSSLDATKMAMVSGSCS